MSLISHHIKWIGYNDDDGLGNPGSTSVLFYNNSWDTKTINSLKVAYALPENINQATLHLIDNSGKQVEQFMVDSHTDHLMLDVSRYKSGVYHYFIEYANWRTESKKLIVR